MWGAGSNPCQFWGPIWINLLTLDGVWLLPLYSLLQSPRDFLRFCCYVKDLLGGALMTKTKQCKLTYQYNGSWISELLTQQQTVRTDNFLRMTGHGLVDQNQNQDQNCNTENESHLLSNCPLTNGCVVITSKCKKKRKKNDEWDWHVQDVRCMHDAQQKAMYYIFTWWGGKKRECGLSSRFLSFSISYSNIMDGNHSSNIWYSIITLLGNHSVKERQSGNPSAWHMTLVLPVKVCL